MEPKTIRPEVWTIAADETGLSLISGLGPWQVDLDVGRDTTIHDEVELLLSVHGIDPVMLHQTSSRDDGNYETVTYVAVVACDDLVVAIWPDAKPIDQALADRTPIPHGPTSSPRPNLRYSDVLLHALRHLVFLMEFDATNARALREAGVARHLVGMRPALAGLYAVEHEAA